MKKDMCRDSADGKITNFGDLSEFSPPLKKPKIDPKAEPVGKAEGKAVAVAEAELPLGRRGFRPKDWNDPEYMRQADIFLEQAEKSKGFYTGADLELDLIGGT
ncbi:hypothetical protein Bca4012_079709 [Brassica carinata]|uniref:BnaC07g33150D protein n=4 Tax=Brassica TaxID=3705 RepID=A0A078JWQ3_BRANA|nr:hypothetical protein HID58_077685 [Brassica napus]CAF2020470.1 unnamed protein product [Brassica napus]CDY09746.1 BnaC07g33150D [Brassica napus]CDY70002.1 BnaCnng66290D [Brassica napus]VDD39691.1 unnamed protein product [Brassica oleracea]